MLKRVDMLLNVNKMGNFAVENLYKYEKVIHICNNADGRRYVTIGSKQD